MSDLVLEPQRRDDLWRAALSSRNFVIGAIIVLIFAGGALLSLIWTPYDPAAQNIPNKFALPSWEHWLGTDHFGRDIFSMILVGARTSIAVAFVAVTFAVIIGTPLGLLAASKRGSLLDEVIMRGNDLVFAFPALLIAILITAVFGPGAINAIIAVGLFNVPVFGRLARAGALSLWPREFIMAARVSGKGVARISFEHILPNIANTLLVQATIQFALGILAEAALAYVGLGVQPPTPSWGKMLADSQTMISLAPHVALVPGLAIVIMVLGVNLMGDGLRDVFDPRLQAGPGMTLLEVKDLSLKIGPYPILRNIDLSVDAGQILGIIGESGSGKSMTALSIMQLLPGGAVNGGSIRLEGVEIVGKPEAEMVAMRGRDIGMVFQEPMTALNPVQTIGDQVTETVLVHGKANREEAMRIARETLDRVGLPAERFPLDRYPHELSGGQRQRVVIAMAIALRPRLLIADEPTTALDVTTQAQILKLLQKLVDEDGMGMILVTHDLAVVADIADRIAIMRQGEVVEAGPTLDVFRTLRHPYSRALFEASSHVPPRIPPTAPGGVPVLKVENLVREYPIHRRSLFARQQYFRAVNGVTFRIGRGENVGLVGESGSGKSTVARAVMALEPTQGGAIAIDGEAITLGASFATRRKMQVVFQDPYGSFNPRHRVDRLVSEPFHLLGSAAPTGAAREAAVARALTEVGLQPSDAGKYIHEFSGGQRQRIAIARALIIEPSLIILDEAVSALDVSIRAQVLDLLAELSDRLQISYLFISHDLTVVRSITDRVLVMRAGQIVEEGETEQVFQSPQHPYTRELIAATPNLERALARREGQ